LYFPELYFTLKMYFTLKIAFPGAFAGDFWLIA